MRSIELFAGAGGLAIATAKAGFTHDAVLEWDKDACDTLRRNAGTIGRGAHEWRVIEGDVTHVDFRPYAGNVEFVSGGPPCQPFSIGGKHRGMDDSRNMFPHAVRAVKEVAPKAFLFENVKGLLRESFANYFQYIVHQLRYPTIRRRGDEEWVDHLARLERAHTAGADRTLSYNVVYCLLNAADYGVPQTRQRVLIAGIRSDLGMEFAFPRPTHSEDALLHAKWVSGEYWERHRIPRSRRPVAPARRKARIEFLKGVPSSMLPRPWRTVRDAIGDLPQLKPGGTSASVPNHFFNPGARSYPGHDGSPWDEPAKTLKAGDHGVPGGENTLRFEDGRVRYFTVRECARLQTFPDDWEFQGSWTESMRQLGNAVPVQMVEAVARALRDSLGIHALADRQSRFPWVYSRASL